MLRRIDSARLVHHTNIFGRGFLYLHVGRRNATVGARKLTKAEFAKLESFQLDAPAFLAELDGRWYWKFQERYFSDNDRLSQQEVHALLVTRDQRNQRKVERALAMVQRGQEPQPTIRGPLPRTSSNSCGCEMAAAVGTVARRPSCSSIT
jgi:hypothetical protein